MVVRLVNVDTDNTEKSSDRNLATWMIPEGKNLRWTCWKNYNRSKLNPYYFNRINVHYTNSDGKRITKSYYCIDSVKEIENMTFMDFDTTKIAF